MTRFLLAAFVLILSTSGTRANPWCNDLWFTRNLIMDRAGYCFGSTLGMQLFDNSNCIGKSVSVAPPHSALVARIQGLERQGGCRVNTAAAYLDLVDARIRRSLIDLPLVDELGLESACLGYLGSPLPLRAGHSQAAPVIGQVLPGDVISFAHMPVGGWGYVTTHAPNFGGLRSGGWLPPVLSEQSCAQWAG